MIAVELIKYGGPISQAFQNYSTVKTGDYLMQLPLFCMAGGKVCDLELVLFFKQKYLVFKLLRFPFDRLHYMIRTFSSTFTFLDLLFGGGFKRVFVFKLSSCTAQRLTTFTGSATSKKKRPNAEQSKIPS